MVHTLKTKKLTTNERIRLGRPIEVWQAGGWTWEVYRKYQKPELEAGNPYARWFCKVRSPFVPEGEFGDVYVHEIKNNARKISEDDKNGS